MVNMSFVQSIYKYYHMNRVAKFHLNRKENVALICFQIKWAIVNGIWLLYEMRQRQYMYDVLCAA